MSTETTTTPAPKRHPLDGIAPYPRSEKEATADAVIRHYTAFGLMHDHLAAHFPHGDRLRESVGHVVSSFTAVHLLLEIRDRLGVVIADEVARDLWMSCECGALPPGLWAWAEEEGLDHDAIEDAADLVAENIRAKALATQAESEARR